MSNILPCCVCACVCACVCWILIVNKALSVFLSSQDRFWVIFGDWIPTEAVQCQTLSVWHKKKTISWTHGGLFHYFILKYSRFSSFSGVRFCSIYQNTSLNIALAFLLYNAGDLTPYLQQTLCVILVGIFVDTLCVVVCPVWLCCPVSLSCPEWIPPLAPMSVGDKHHWNPPRSTWWICFLGSQCTLAQTKKKKTNNTHTFFILPEYTPAFSAFYVFTKTKLQLFFLPEFSEVSQTWEYPSSFKNTILLNKGANSCEMSSQLQFSFYYSICRPDPLFSLGK